MQDLVAVRVADAAQEPRVGERALEGVALAGERRAEGCEVGVEHLEAAGVEGRHGRRPAHDVQRGALLRARLREHQRAGRKLERGKSHLPRDARAGRPPVKAARDHQMEDEEEVALELEDDALADPAESDDASSHRLRERRVDRADEERRAEPHAHEGLVEHARRQVLDVDDDVG